MKIKSTFPLAALLLMFLLAGCDPCDYCNDQETEEPAIIPIEVTAVQVPPKDVNADVGYEVTYKFPSILDNMECNDGTSLAIVGTLNFKEPVPNYTRVSAFDNPDEDGIAVFQDTLSTSCNSNYLYNFQLPLFTNLDSNVVHLDFSFPNRAIPGGGSNLDVIGGGLVIVTNINGMNNQNLNGDPVVTTEMMKAVGKATVLGPL